MKTGRTVLAVLLIAVAVVFVSAPVLAQSDGSAFFSPAEQEKLAKEAAKAFKSAARSYGIQAEFPCKTSPSSVTTPCDDTVKQPPPKQKPERKPLVLSPELAKVLLIIAIVVFMIIIAVTLKNNLWSQSRARKLAKKKEQVRAVDPEATSIRMEKAQSEADVLAAQGKYAEAMHVLLLQSVSELKLRLSVSIAVSLTSREILQRIGLPPKGHDVFSDIVKRVEISYFGYHQPGAEDYTACRQSYDTLTDILRKGGSAA